MLEQILNRFEELAETADDGLMEAHSRRLAQGAACDLAPLRLSKVKVDLDEPTIERDREAEARLDHLKQLPPLGRHPDDA